MGLLDELLGGLAGGGLGQPVDRPPAQASAGMGNILTALLPVALAMLASRQGGGSTGVGGPGGAGGLGGLLDQFRRMGYARQADSWVSTGPNLPISPDVIGQVFGREGLSKIAAQAGVSEEQASAGLAKVLPEVVNHVTPEGREPDFDALTASVATLRRRLGA
jgi:uncharacterized protein YidB (DUF937 family)